MVVAAFVNCGWVCSGDNGRINNWHRHSNLRRVGVRGQQKDSAQDAALSLGACWMLVVAVHAAVDVFALAAAAEVLAP